MRTKLFALFVSLPLAQGGPWNFDQFAATCDFAEVPQRQDSTTPQLGFRCCKD